MSPLISVRVFLALLWGTSALLSTQLNAAASGNITWATHTVETPTEKPVQPAAIPETKSNITWTTHTVETPAETPTAHADQSHTPAKVDASTAVHGTFHPTTVETHNTNKSDESTTVLVVFSTAAAQTAATAGETPASHHTLERGLHASTTLKAVTGTQVTIQPVIQATTSVPQPPVSNQNSTSPTPDAITSQVSSTSQHLPPAPAQTTAPAAATANPTTVQEITNAVTESSSTSKNPPPESIHASTVRVEANSTSLPSDPTTLKEMSASSTSKNPPLTSAPSSTAATVKANATSLPSDPTTTSTTVREIMDSSTSKHLSPTSNHTSASEVHPTSTPGSSTLSSTNATTTASPTFLPSTTSTSAAPCVVPSSHPSGEPFPCSTRGMAQQCLIAVASLAAVATVFIVCTIVLCTKLSARKYKVRSPPATEMTFLPSLLNERSYHYARHRNPITNGVLVIHGGDSDEDGGDNLTLSSFLPENERYV